MKRLITLTLLLLSLVMWAQTKKLSYRAIENGIAKPDRTHTILCSEQLAYLSKPQFAIQEWIDYKRQEVVETMVFDSVLYKTVQAFSELPKAISDEASDPILKFKTSKSTYTSFSNTIEVWYTNQSEVKGSIYKGYLPNREALVLKVLINGKSGWELTKIESASDEKPLDYPYASAQTITKPEARALQIASRYTRFPVFDKAQINWGDEIINPSERKANVLYRFGGGNIILKKIKLPDINRAGGQIFATLTNWSNGDAYDRIGTVFTIAEDKTISMLDAYFNDISELPVVKDNSGREYQGMQSTEQYETPVELMRFFTSFGVHHFNSLREIDGYNWSDSIVYKQEITHLIPNDQNEIWIGVFISNYDKGGHFVSLDLQFYPPWEAVDTVAKKFILPLFNTVNTLEMKGQNYGKMFDGDTLELDFDIPEGIENLELVYTTTGHGGWGGGDEFNPKLNEIRIDGQTGFSIVPWRSDCGTYRMANPASGNFSNGLSSSDLSRSNWCPATLTPPFIIPLKDIKLGKHHIQIIIDMGKPEGNSFSHWSVSGVLTGTYTK